jgi:PAS domain S-box-containing protein
MNTIFEEMFERSPVAMLLVDADGSIRLVNRHAERLFEYDRSELINASIEILVPESVRDRHPELVRSYVGSPLPRQMGKGRNFFGVKKDESVFPVEVGLNPIEVDGRIMVLGSVIDITERLRAEERFKAAVEGAPNGMLMVDASRKIVLCNQKIEEIFGFARDELIGHPIEILVPDDFKAPHPKLAESYFRNPQSRAIGIGREFFGRHKSGRLIPVEIGLQPIHSSGETFVISSVVDISYRRTAEVEIKRKTEEIEEFSYRTSHDLRSPLKSIASMADCVAESLDEREYVEARSGVVKISHLAVKLLALIEDILTLTKVDAAVESTAVFDFDAFSELVREKFGAALAEAETDLEFAFLHRRQLVVAPSRLTQVLDNLVGNGIKYSDKDKDARVVRVHTLNNASRFFIQVEDNGTGIPVERQAEVFGMFKRFHSSSIPGSGLGLYIAKKQVDKLGADISFESSPAGTTFHLEFNLDHPR